MDIDFIEEEYRDDIFRLMEMCGIDMAEAYTLYITSGNNLDNAVQRKFNPPSPQKPPSFNHEVSYEQDDTDPDERYRKFKQFVRSGEKAFNRKYEIVQTQSFFKRIIPQIFKGESENLFKKVIEEKVGRRVALKLEEGSLSQAFQKSWRDKFPLLIHMVSLKNVTIMGELKTIYSDDLFVEKTLAEMFINYAINADTYAIEPFLKPFVDYPRDKDCFIIARVNYLDEIVVVDRISLRETLAEIKKRFKMAKNKCIHEQMSDAHLHTRYSEQLAGNLDYVQPKGIKEHTKLKEDRSIRRNQEQEFLAALQVHEATKPSVKEQEKEPQISAEQLKEQRMSLRQKLPIYTSGIDIKLRLPSGQSLTLKVDVRESVDYLFKFVESEHRQLGFQNQGQRHFDIIRPYDRLSLKGKQDALHILFEDSTSETLVVTELL